MLFIKISIADRKLDLRGGRGSREGARWELDELAVRQSILRWRRVRVMLGTWGRERLRRKGGFRARIEALFAVWGQAARGGDERTQTSESLRVKEPAFLEPAFLELRQIPNRGRNRLRGLATNVPPTAFGIMTAKRA